MTVQAMARLIKTISIVMVTKHLLFMTIKKKKVNSKEWQNKT